MSGDSGDPPDPRTLRRSAIKGFAWAALSFGGNKLLLLVSTLVLTRLLDVSEFGIVAAALTVVTYLEVVLDLGVGSALIYGQERGFTRSVHTAFTVNIGVCASLAIVNLQFAPVVARFFGAPQEVNIFRALAVYILLRGVGQIQDALLKRDLRFRQKAAADLVRAVVRGGLSVGLAVAGYGAWALVWGFLAAEAAGTFTAWSLTRYRPRLMLDRRSAASLLKFGAPVVALDLLSQIGLNSDYLIVGHSLGLVALGLYTIAFRLPELFLSNVYWVFAAVAFPVFSKSRTTGQAAFRGSMLKALQFITLFGFAVGTALALLSRDAVQVLFSPKWAEAATPMALISLAIGVGAIGYASGDIFKAAGRPTTLLVVNSIGTALEVTGFLVAVPFGITAVASVHLGFNVLYAVVRLAIANRFVGATWGNVLVALRPALCLSGCLVLFGFPVRLLLPAGATSLLLTTAAVLVGAVVGLAAVGRSTLRDLRELGRDLVHREQRSAVVGEMAAGEVRTSLT